jgi:hypothetical protein
MRSCNYRGLPRPLCLILHHLHKHLHHIGQAKLFLSRSLMLPERVELASSDLVALDRIRLDVECTYVIDETARASGGNSIGLLGMSRI